MSRTLIGMTTIVAGGTAIWGWASGSIETAGVAARVAVILGAIWLAYPSFRRLTPRSLVLGGAALLIILFRPRAAFVVLPVLAFTLGRTGRRRQHSDP